MGWARGTPQTTWAIYAVPQTVAAPVRSLYVLLGTAVTAKGQPEQPPGTSLLPLSGNLSFVWSTATGGGGGRGWQLDSPCSFA